MTWKDLPAGQITFRQIKGEPLTYEEADINFGWLQALIEALFFGGIITASPSDENNDGTLTIGETQVKVSWELLASTVTEQIGTNTAALNNLNTLVGNYLQENTSWMDNSIPETKMAEVVGRNFQNYPTNVSNWMSFWLDSADGENIMSGWAKRWVNNLGGKDVIQSAIGATPPVAKVVSLSNSADTDAIFKYDTDNDRYVTDDGTMFFDTDTNKTLTFFSGVLFDSMGNVVAGESV